MKSLTKRLLTAAVAIPLLIIVALLPQQNYLAFFFVIVFADVVGTYEMKENILSKIGHVPSSAYLGVLMPIAHYIQLSLCPTINLSMYSFAMVVGIACAIEIFAGAKDNFKDTLGRLGRAILAITYPSLFGMFLVKLCFMNKANWMIIYFLALVFGTDSFAYFTGMAFGKNNKGFIKVSPNKSVAGFIGGILVPAIAGAVTPLLFPNVFTYLPWQGFIIGAVTAVFSCVGDLIESCFKRASGVKDSGVIIPGRGGMLDSIDSILISIPFYLVFMELFLGA